MTGPDVAEYAGITYRQLDYWCSEGWIRPTDPTPGTGIARHFSPDEIQITRWMGHLVRHGLTPHAAAGIARDLHATGHARLGLFTITTATPTHQEASTAA